MYEEKRHELVSSNCNILCVRTSILFLKTLESELTPILPAEATPLLYTEASTVNNIVVNMEKGQV